MSNTKHTVGICFHCGADDGLHQYETMKCPLYGREESNPNKPQRWAHTTFENKEWRKTRDAAPELLEALKNACERMERARGIVIREGGNWGMLDTSDLRPALKKATE